MSHKCHSHMIRRSHDGCGKVVHRPCSNCISSVLEITGILENYLDMITLKLVDSPGS